MNIDDVLGVRREAREQWFAAMEAVQLPKWLAELIPDVPALEEGVNSVGMSNVESYRNSLSVLKSRYKYWVEETHPKWLADPNDWVKAYHWLENHPVLWTRMDGEKTVHWNTDFGLSSMWTSVRKNADGEVVVMLEHGPHHGDLTLHAHDTRTEAYEETFEKAYVSLAKSFHQYYDKDGNDRCENTCCGTYSELYGCEKHESLHDELHKNENDPNWAYLVEDLWAAADNSSDD